MWGLSRPEGRRRFGRRSSGRTPNSVGLRAMGVALACVTGMIFSAAPAGAEDAMTDSTSVAPAQVEPLLFGLGAAGLLWLLAGLIALTVGIVLATRRARMPITGQLFDPSAQVSTGTRTSSDDEPGGARR